MNKKLKAKLAVGAIVTTGALSLLVGASNTYAAEIDTSNRLPMVQELSKLNYSQIDEFFKGFSDDVTVVPNGRGILHGKVEIADSNNLDRIIQTIDTDTDENALTIGELKDILKTTTFGPTLEIDDRNQSEYPPNFAYLGLGAFHKEAMSGNGWRFGSSLFAPTNGTGDYLRWETFVDSGRVGDSEDIRHTINTQQPVYGLELTPGTPRYATGIGNFTAYFTWSPLPNTSYYVINQ